MKFSRIYKDKQAIQTDLSLLQEHCHVWQQLFQIAAASVIISSYRWQQVTYLVDNSSHGWYQHKWQLNQLQVTAESATGDSWASYRWQLIQVQVTAEPATGDNKRSYSCKWQQQLHVAAAAAAASFLWEYLAAVGIVSNPPRCLTVMFQCRRCLVLKLAVPANYRPPPPAHSCMQPATAPDGSVVRRSGNLWVVLAED